MGLYKEEKRESKRTKQRRDNRREKEKRKRLKVKEKERRRRNRVVDLAMIKIEKLNETVKLRLWRKTSEGGGEKYNGNKEKKTNTR
jgi:hypothetical protein